MLNILNREPWNFDDRGEYLTGKRVLVTGAGGSIGSELVRQIANRLPSKLVMMGHGESTLMSTNQDIGLAGIVEVADIRDSKRVLQVMHQHTPQIVFHAAALKHQPVLERSPYEAMMTNVFGTSYLMSYAKDCGVEQFVNVSTDKAADPSCVLGASKRIGERLGSWFGKGFVSVRFGNVIGSRGSVIGTFARQLANGQPVTVTSPNVDRYFMTVSEAAKAAIFSGSLNTASSAIVMKMGSPVNIAGMAVRMAELMGVQPNIVFTGLRPGEKLHETLIGRREYNTEILDAPFYRVFIPPLDPMRSQLTLDGSIVTDTTQMLSASSASLKEAMLDLAYASIDRETSE